ncbi:MAG TPA: hypothetical protein VL981_06240 [Candidatus Methylacidiphilales bacterium]|nr:hypothetical protein [Candidatus Methylacidiphilales bacterium]
MKLTLIAAIRYLEKFTLKPEETILIDLWGHEGYELQDALRQYEGAISLRNTFNLPGWYTPRGNAQINCLFEQIGKADLAVLFIDAYPVEDVDDEGRNLQVAIMHRGRLQDALRQFAQYLTLPGERKAPLKRNATASRRSGRGHKTPILAHSEA